MNDEQWAVTIVCTDRGQHKRTKMTCFEWRGETEGWHSHWPVELKHAMYGPPDPKEESGSVVSRDSYGFCCARCTRWPKISVGRWIKIMEATRRAGLGEFDVSYID